MSKLYTFLKYFFIVFWAVFVVAPFLWALTTSFKDFQSVNGGVTYIPWVDFEPNLEGWKVLIKSPAKGGVDIVEPYFNSLFVTCTASLISIILGTLSAYALSRYLNPWPRKQDLRRELVASLLAGDTVGQSFSLLFQIWCLALLQIKKNPLRQ